MRINNWWVGDSSEIYWMEITGRSDLGADLRAPKLNEVEKEEWSYALTTHVQPGDRVFHWDRERRGESAIVAWSEAIGPLQTIQMPWHARGATARARGSAIEGMREAWSMPLGGLTYLAEPITRSMINRRHDEIANLLEVVERAAAGSAYAPFQNYGGYDLRAQQGYLTKFPAALVEALFALPVRTPEDRGADVQKPTRATATPRVSRSQGFVSDATLRSALERHALNAAREFYQREGATEIVELGKPYDLRVIIDGNERHVEVKGSSGRGIESVQLTQGEVDHAASWIATDLFVVEDIAASRSADGSVRTSGGTVRLWRDWKPLTTALRPTHLRYTLPKPN